MAIPLCLPNNCTWDSETGLRVSSEEERRYLYVVEDALEQLRKIKEPVCVVSIAGPYRRGKSFVLSEVFGQPEVFPLGHKMKPETMGIWLWIVPRAFEDSTGREFKVVLLDTEGTDAVTSESYDNSQIFTLTVLLSSVLIYNSQCVPTRADREGLNYIAKLSQSIEGPSKTKAEAGKSQEDLKFFCKTFPFLIWLLRDDTLDLPSDCNSYKEYFLKEVYFI
ncbi:unnamed protein product [Porites evermanni]|uniref:GB1/RHD3-type G domain-containing protein n=1 Tax=Porites evermanni TaxID=104178 RepID=A0ABN8R2R6_9CNID|nr:unnamed protein product [Porites evermanni]